MFPKQPSLVVAVAALGYFVDIYDLVLFGILRLPSVRGLGVPEAQVLPVSLHLLNWQMGGMLVGGILWGVLGDRRGRVSVLFGSIVLYSLANVANGMVTSLDGYAALRFLAGVGLSGELGAGITLTSEILSREARGWGTTLVAGVGVFGAVAASLVGGHLPWRTSYFVGGGLGLVLLVLRAGAFESGMFARMAETPARRGAFLSLFTSWARAERYVSVVLIGLPIWFVIGVLVLLAPELGRALGLPAPPSAPTAILLAYTGLGVGDLASGALSQLARSRRRAVGAFLGITCAAVILYFTLGGRSAQAFYACCLLLGIGGGYWAVFVTMASEQFGTNLRATVTTTAPNFVRGAVVPMTLAFTALKGVLGHGAVSDPGAVLGAAAIVGGVSLLLAFAGLSRLRETYGRDLDYLEAC